MMSGPEIMGSNLGDASAIAIHHPLPENRQTKQEQTTHLLQQSLLSVILLPLLKAGSLPCARAVCIFVLKLQRHGTNVPSLACALP